jgi:TnpA family transposase
MARRRLLSDEQLAPLWAWASDERAIVRHYALSRADLDLIAKKRTASNRLGFAVLMCGMRFPGRVLDAAETPPAAVLAFIADQVGVTPAQFVTYRQRPTNRREHIAELMESLGCRAFDTDATASCWLLPCRWPRAPRARSGWCSPSSMRRDRDTSCCRHREQSTFFAIEPVHAANGCCIGRSRPA